MQKIIYTLMNKIYFMNIQNTENQLPHYLLFLDSCLLEQLLFQKTLPSIAAAFPEELLFYNILFQKSYYFSYYKYFSIRFLSTVTLLICLLVIK